MKTRIITGTLLAIVLGLLVYFGEGELSFIFTGFCVLLALLASIEFTKMRRHDQAVRWFDYIAVINTVIFASVSVIYMTDLDSFFKAIFFVVVFVILINALLFVFIKEYTREDFGSQILTMFYCSLGFIAFAYLRLEGIGIIIYLFLVSMLTDVFAYFIGVQFGKHRLAEHISPKKSIEGAIGGLVFGAISASLFAYYFNIMEHSFIIIILLSIILSCISQLGDLIASKFKREVGIKDYSNLLPGHGGILDRFDSSMFAAAFLMLATFLL